MRELQLRLHCKGQLRLRSPAGGVAPLEAAVGIKRLPACLPAPHSAAALNPHRRAPSPSIRVRRPLSSLQSRARRQQQRLTAAAMDRGLALALAVALVAAAAAPAAAQAVPSPAECQSRVDQAGGANSLVVR